LREGSKDITHNYGTRHPGEDLRFHIPIHVGVIPEHPWLVVLGIEDLLEVRRSPGLDADKNVIAIVLGRNIGAMVVEVGGILEGIDDRNVQLIARRYPECRRCIETVIDDGLYLLPGDVHLGLCGGESCIEDAARTVQLRRVGERFGNTTATPPT
jgi:hypothetical protein